MNCPVLVTGFNRASLAKKVLNELQHCDPLYLFCDGPTQRSAKETQEVIQLFEKTKSNAKTRRVELYQSSKNLGAKDGPFTALNWVLNQEGETLIVEEDVIPHPEFLPTYTQALKAYRKHPEVAALGSGGVIHWPNAKTQWIQTNLFLSWGWGTWRPQIPTELPQDLWPKHREKILQGFERFATKAYLAREFNQLRRDPQISCMYFLQQLFLVSNQRILSPASKVTHNQGVSPTSRRTKCWPDQMPNEEAIRKWKDLAGTSSPYNPLFQHAMEKAKFPSAIKTLRIYLSLRTRIRNLLKR